MFPWHLHVTSPREAMEHRGAWASAPHGLPQPGPSLGQGAESRPSAPLVPSGSWEGGGRAARADDVLTSRSG